MSGYLSYAQVAKLLEPINEKRVSTDGKGFSHVEAYELRAQMTRLFGFARWSEDVTEQALIFEDERTLLKKDYKTKQPIPGTEYQAWTVAYRSVVRVTVCAPDGTILCTYTEGATGEASNQPSRGDAHDLALKTSQSQAFKRAVVNLGDAFGISLYRKGSTQALVFRTLVAPTEGNKAPEPEHRADVDAHITETLPPESPAAQTPAPTDAAPQAPSGQDPVSNIRDRILKATRKRELATLLMSAQRDGVQGALTTDADGNGTTVEKLIQKQIAGAAA
jgi:Rad52/22 family double-strand break repair protein